MFLTFSARVFATRKKTILDFTFEEFDSYVDLRSFGFRTL